MIEPPFLIETDVDRTVVLLVDSAPAGTELRLIAQIAPNIPVTDALVVDCSGTIVMPGFITTHHHQYETLQRSVIPDGLLAGAWPLDRWRQVGRALGAFNGRFLVEGVPGHDWLGRGWIRTWVDEITPVAFPLMIAPFDALLPLHTA